MVRKSTMLSVILLPVLLLAVPALPVSSAPLNCIFEHYSSEDGLSHNSIADIHQDRTGYIWLCTWYGLSRFDGNTFVNYSILPGDYTKLSHNRLLSIDEDSLGYLWIIQAVPLRPRERENLRRAGRHSRRRAEESACEYVPLRCGWQCMGVFP